LDVPAKKAHFHHKKESFGKTTMEREWCQRRELNPRPKAYESSALPLSYSGITTTKSSEARPFAITANTFIYFPPWMQYILDEFFCTHCPSEMISLTGVHI
jgi:hypothetical protein